MPARADVRRARAGAALLLLAVSLAPMGCRKKPPAPTGARGWRTDGTGRYPEASPPLHWSKDKNVVWKTPMPDWSNATPVLAGDRVFVTAEPYTLLAVSASDGRILWRHDASVLDAVPPAERAEAARKLAEADAAIPRLNQLHEEMSRLKRTRREDAPDPALDDRITARMTEYNTLVASLKDAGPYRARPHVGIVGTASFTPVTDGNNVYVVFGNHVAESFDLDGKLRWARLIPDADDGAVMGAEGESASPLYGSGHLYVPLAHLRALDAATGEIRWTGPRYVEFGTPALARVGNEDLIVTPHGMVIRGSDGTVLAKGTRAFSETSPVVDGLDVFFAGMEPLSSHSGMRVVGLRLPETLAGFQLARLFEVDMGNEHPYASPLVHGPLLITIENAGVLHAWDRASGATIHSRRLDAVQGDISSSPVLAGSRIYMTSESGVTVVLDGKPPFAQLADNKTEQVRASLVFSDDRLYLRGFENLYCISERARSTQ